MAYPLYLREKTQPIRREKGNRAMCEKHLRIRERAYSTGRHSFHALARDPMFRDFRLPLHRRGYKRCRNTVSLGNSDPGVIDLAYRWIGAFARNQVTFEIQYHEDQNPAMLIDFWCDRLKVDPARIRYQRESNSGS